MFLIKGDKERMLNYWMVFCIGVSAKKAPRGRSRTYSRKLRFLLYCTVLLLYWGLSNRSTKRKVKHKKIGMLELEPD